MSDITVGISYTINSIIGVFSQFFYTLDSISFFGITLLDYNIAIMLISVLLPIVLTLVRGNYTMNSRYYRAEKRYAEIRNSKKSNSKKG